MFYWWFFSLNDFWLSCISFYFGKTFAVLLRHIKSFSIKFGSTLYIRNSPWFKAFSLYFHPKFPFSPFDLCWAIPKTIDRCVPHDFVLLPTFSVVHLWFSKTIYLIYSYTDNCNVSNQLSFLHLLYKSRVEVTERLTSDLSIIAKGTCILESLKNSISLPVNSPHPNDLFPLL